MNRWGLSLVLALTSMGCLGHDSYRLLDAPDGEDPWASRRARLDVTVVRGGQPGAGNTISVSVDDVIGYAMEDCVASRQPGVTPEAHRGCEGVTRDPEAKCNVIVCQTNLALCAAHRLREYAETLTVMPTAALHDFSPVSIVPQDNDGRVALNEAALGLAQLAMTYAGENLRAGAEQPSDADFVSCNDDDMDALPGNDSLTLGDSLAHDFAEAVRLVDEAGQAAYETNVAAADAEFSLTTNPGEAARNVWTAPVLSRLRAAQLMTGAYEWTRSNTAPANLISAQGINWLYRGNGACSSTDRNLGVGLLDSQRARDILRTAGVDPSDILRIGEIDFDDLYLGGGGVSVGLREAFEELSPTAVLSGIDPLGPDEFLTSVRLTRNDFVTARTQMAQEFVAFGRDTHALMPPLTVGSDGMGTPQQYSHPRYVATTQPPVVPPSSYFVRLARLADRDDDDRRDEQDEDVRPSTKYARRGVAPSIDYATTVAYEVLELPQITASARESLAGILAAQWERRSARLETCHVAKDGGEQRVDLRLYADLDAPTLQNDLLVVDGMAGVSCATRGNVDGAPCALAEHEVIVTYNVHTVSDRSYGFPRSVSFSVPLPMSGVDYYLVRRRSGAANHASGAYAEVGPIYVEYAPGAPKGTTCVALPIVEGISNTVLQSMASDSNDCGRPVSPCATITDGRLPLENELIDDGNDFESSWRHHIEVARVAAEHADRLGEELIDAGYAVDQRADAANEALLSVCGATVNLDGLFDDAAGDMVSAMPCASDEIEVGSSCVRLHGRRIESLAASDRDARLLEECLGDDAVVPLVGLGSQTLCVWRDDDDFGVICAGASAAQPCPFAATGSSCTMVGAPPSGTTIVMVDEMLGISGSPELPRVGGSAAPPDCDDVRLLRSASSLEDHQAALERIRATNFFRPDHLAGLARRIGWEARPLSHSALTLDGTPWVQTGEIFAGPMSSETWPCALTVPGRTSVPETAACAALGSPLFCGSLDCSNATARAEWNTRVGRAALLVAMTSGGGLSAITFPTQYQRSEDLIVVGPISPIQLDPWLVASSTTLLDRGSPARPWEVSSTGLHPFHDAIDSFLSPGRNTDVGGLFVRSADGQNAWATSATSDELGEWTGFVRAGDLLGNARDEDRYTISRIMWQYASSSSVSLPRDTGGWPQMSRLALEAWPFRPGDVAFHPFPAHGRIEHLTRYYDFNRWMLDIFGLYTQKSVNMLDITAPARGTFSSSEVVDGMELYCEAAHALDRGGLEACAFGAVPDAVVGRSDLPRLRSFLECAANRIEAQSQMVVLQNLPRRVVDEWRGGTAHTAADGGDLTRSSAEIRESLLSLGGMPALIAAQVRHMRDDLMTLERQLAGVDARREVAELGALSSALDRVTSCVTSGQAALVGCANAFAQIAISIRVTELTHRQLALEEDEAVQGTLARMRDRIDALNQIEEQMSVHLNRLNGAQAAFESARAAARRAVANASMMTADFDTRSLPVNTLLMNRYEIRRARYDEARRNAVRLAYIARRSLEQRLGTSLESLGSMTLVEDPGGWVNRLCDASGIDYRSLRRDSLNGYSTSNFMYVGDYVRRLDAVFESYRFDYPFSSATDTTVVSVRDDIVQSRVSCETPVYNMLANGGRLNGHGWSDAGCVDIGESEEEIVGCVTPVPVDPELGPGEAFIDSPHDGVAGAYRVVFAGGTSGTGSPEVSFGDDSRLEQRITLRRPGAYVLSWYGREPGALSSAADPEEAVVLTTYDGDELDESATFALTGEGPGAWTRYFRLYRTWRAGEFAVAIVPQGMNAAEPDEQTVDVAALQLEDVSELVTEMPSSLMAAADRHRPRAFVETTSRAGHAMMASCEDARGVAFRRHWSPVQYARVCPRGEGATCSETEASLLGFRDYTFSISQAQIERGDVFGQSGIARGNFNYRTDSIAVNFVGTGVRACDRSPFPSSCYSSGNIQYSIYHTDDGPGFQVRNHAGGIYDAPLFPGIVEQARGVAAERYVTNPMSSADAALVGPYLRRELMGRPLAGHYTIRVWETPGVNFEAIEDVQVILNYRYWTRLERR